MSNERVLDVHNLQVAFKLHQGEVQAVRGSTFSVRRGETLAIVGESGSGKSVTAQSLMKLIDTPPGVYKAGSITFEDKDIMSKTDKEMDKVRGKDIGMIFQDPMTSLNPTMKVGNQIIEGMLNHEDISKSEAKKRAIELLDVVGIPSPESRYSQYPHEFSGGMRQRVVIAIALASNPSVLIADEPTTALDVTTQAQILQLMDSIKERFGTAIILITHDLGVVANAADRVAVMYGGKIVEKGTIDEIFYQSEHPYTWGLLASMPRLHASDETLLSIPGTPPDLSDPPKGCPFAARCQYAMGACVDHMPDYTHMSDTHETACWLLDERAPDVEAPDVARKGDS